MRVLDPALDPDPFPNETTAAHREIASLAVGHHSMILSHVPNHRFDHAAAVVVITRADRRIHAPGQVRILVMVAAVFAAALESDPW